MIKFDLDGHTSISSDDKGRILVSYTKNGSPPTLFRLDVFDNALFVFTASKSPEWKDEEVVLNPKSERPVKVKKSIEVKADAAALSKSEPISLEPSSKKPWRKTKGWDNFLNRQLTPDELQRKKAGEDPPYDGTNPKKAKGKGWGGKRVKASEPSGANTASGDEGSSSDDVPGEEIIPRSRAPDMDVVKASVLPYKQPMISGVSSSFFVAEKGEAPDKVNPKLFIRLEDTSLLPRVKALLKKTGLEYVGDVIYFDLGKFSDLLQGSEPLRDLKEYIEKDLELKFNSVSNPRRPYWRPSNAKEKSYEFFPEDCDVDERLFELLGC